VCCTIVAQSERLKQDYKYLLTEKFLENKKEQLTVERNMMNKKIQNSLTGDEKVQAANFREEIKVCHLKK